MAWLFIVGAMVFQLLIWAGGALLFLWTLRYVYRFVTAPPANLAVRTPIAPAALPEHLPNVPIANAEPPEPVIASPEADPDIGGDLVDLDPDEDVGWTVFNPFKPIQKLENARIQSWLGLITSTALLILYGLVLLAMFMKSPRDGEMPATQIVEIFIVLACAAGVFKTPPSRVAAIVLTLLAFYEVLSATWGYATYNHDWTGRIIFILTAIAFGFGLTSVRGAIWYRRISKSQPHSTPPAATQSSTIESGATATIGTLDLAFHALPLAQRLRIAWNEQRAYRRALHARSMTYLAIIVGGFLLLGVGSWIFFASQGAFETTKTSATVTSVAAAHADAPSPPRRQPWRLRTNPRRAMVRQPTAPTA